MENPMPGRTKTLDFASKAALFMLACCAIVTPISIISIGSELGISLASRGGLETARTIPLIATILVSGVITGRASLKLLISAGLWLMTAGLVLMGLSKTFPVAVIAMVVLGAGSGFIEALINPIVTSLHPDTPELHLNTAHAFFSIGLCICVLLFGELLSRGLSWRTLYFMSSIGTLGTAILFQASHFPENTPDRFSGRTYLGILKRPLFWIFCLTMFFSAGNEGGLTFWTASFIETYYSDVPRLWGFGTAIFGFSMAVGRMTIGRLSAHVPVKLILLIAAGGGVLVSALIAYTTRLSAVMVLIFAAGLCTSGFWPSVLALASKRIHTDTTAVFTLLISSGIGGFAAFPWLIGLVADHTSLRGAFFIIPVLFLILVPLLLLMRPEKS